MNLDPEIAPTEAEELPAELLELQKLAEPYFAEGATLPRVSRELQERVDPDAVEPDDEDRPLL